MLLGTCARKLNCRPGATDNETCNPCAKNQRLAQWVPSEVPAELVGFTMLEEMLIAQVLPLMQM